MALNKVIIAFTLSIFVASASFAQTAQTEEKTKSSGGPRKQLATIIFAGLGGAVLGLSTLSFYGRPQDNLSNIAVGFAFGVITGTVIVTYRAATNPSEFYGSQYRPDESYKIASHLTAYQSQTPMKLHYDFEF